METEAELMKKLAEVERLLAEYRAAWRRELEAQADAMLAVRREEVIA